MRRFLFTFFLALALIGSVNMPVAHAGVHAPTSPAPSVGAPPALSPPAPKPEWGDAIGTAAAELKAKDEGTKTKPLAFDPSTAEAGYNYLMIKLMSLFAWLLGVAMLTLDYAVYYTVVTMGTYVNNLSAIGVAWRILRDIGNILLIFGFLAVGITVILNVDWYGGGKKFLPMLLVAAVFLNFSLFMAMAVIDTGNLFATHFYAQINGGSLPKQGPSGWLTTASGETITPSNEGVSNKIMSQLGLQTIYGNARENQEIFKGGNPTLIGFMGILLFLTAAFVMFSLAFMLIARFIALIFLIILSPIGFAGLATPQLKSTADQWWSELFKQTITAPILLLLLYIALAVITDAKFLTGFGTSSAAWDGLVGDFNLPGFAGVLLSFIVAMGFLLAVVYFSKKLGAIGGSWAMKTAGKLTFGATAFGLRSTVGAGLYAASRGARGRLGGGKFERLVAGGLDRGANAKFDLRNVKAIGGLKAAGIDLGDGLKHGYAERRENAIKGHKEYTKSVGEAIDERHAGVVAESARNFYKTQQEKQPIIDDSKEQQEKLADEVKKFTKNVSDLKASIDKFGSSKSLEDELLNKQNQLTQVTEGLKKEKKREEKANEQVDTARKADKDLGDRISNEKKTAQLKYADSIKGSPINWAMHGPGGTAAANSIIKDALKKKDKIKDIKKILAEDDDEEGSKKPKPKVEESVQETKESKSEETK